MAHLSKKCGNSDGHSAYYYWGFLSHSLDPWQSHRGIYGVGSVSSQHQRTSKLCAEWRRTSSSG